MKTILKPSNEPPKPPSTGLKTSLAKSSIFLHAVAVDPLLKPLSSEAKMKRLTTMPL